MGIIFGPDGTYTTPEGMALFNGDNGGSDIISHGAGVSFCNHGMMSGNDNMSLFDGGIISKNGNTYCGPNRIYTYSGEILCGNGKMWTGIMSDQDIRDIIAHDSY